MERVLNSNIGAVTTARLALAPSAQTAGATASATGLSIDRFSLVSPPNSALFCAGYTGNLATGKTLSISLDVQDSADGVNFSDYATTAAQVVATGTTGSSAVAGQVTFSVNLTSAREWVRLITVPTLSATQTDTCTVFGTVTFGGQDRIPSPA
jgi:hypothetical protein